MQLPWSNETLSSPSIFYFVQCNNFTKLRLGSAVEVLLIPIKLIVNVMVNRRNSSMSTIREKQDRTILQISHLFATIQS